MTQPTPLSTLVNSLREEQTLAVDAAVGTMLAKLAGGVRGNEASLLLVSPTGTGKSFIQGAAHRLLTEEYGKRVFSTFPQSEIADAVFKKTYGYLPEGSPNKRAKELERHGFWTIKRLHNELVAGRVRLPDVLQHDEAHHSVDDTHEVVHGICGLCPRIGATATDYRGTAVETQKFRERWPQSHRVLTLRAAVGLGRLSMPSWDVWPLLDDELIDVKGGEFVVSKVESAIKDKLEDLVDRIKPFFTPTNRDGLLKGVYDRPTMIAVPGVKAVEAVVDALRKAGLPAVGVTGETTDFERASAFEGCIARYVILVQIRVVGEGVDLPIRRLIDLAPTVSPVLWMQRVGRITRPVGDGELPPEYIACCHNLARHAYLWHGVMPPSTVKKALEAWGKDFKPSRRFLARAIDVEGIGRFQPAAIPFVDAGVGTMYVMQSKDGADQYAIVLHPLRPDPWFFARNIPYTGRVLTKEIKEGVTVEFRERDYNAKEARWRVISSLPELRGMQTIKAGPLTTGQGDWWKKSAKGFGLDAEAEITNREFAILPILANSRVGKLEA